jgi:ubiquinone/menaquinone biosynthesis C-methylase UbiE
MSTTNTAEFCSVRFKETTRAQWQEAADAWHRWGPLLGEWLGEATDLMLDMGGVKKGGRVLDVAAGAGEQSVTAARRVGPSGRVLATDISPNILRLAGDAASAAGVNNVEVKEIDGENLSDLDAATFDTVISRVGMIYFPDQLKALQGMRHTLVDGGRVSLITYSTADMNKFFSLPVSIIRKRANLPAPLPGQPGPFSLGDPEVLTTLLENAGFKDVVVKRVNAPVRVKTADECLQFEKESFGALHQMLSTLDECAQEKVWEEIGTALDQFEGPDGFEGPCELLVAAGTK